MLPYFSLGPLTVFTYPLIIGFLWAGSYFLSQELLRSKKEIVNKFNIYFLSVFCSAWVGAKILFLAPLDQDLIIRAVNSSNFWLGGGFVFYGGLIFGLCSTFIFSKLTKQPISKFSFSIPVLAFAHAFGRIGCFLAGCCYGSKTDFLISLSMHGHTRHPVQLYEAIGLFILALILIKLYLKNKPILGLYFVSYSVLRFSLEFLRGDEIRGLFFGLSTSQIISLFIITIYIFFEYFSKKRAPVGYS